MESMQTSVASSVGGQNYIPAPDMLFYKADKLYKIKNGKLLKKKSRGIWSKKKFVPWYVKQKIKT
jgi:hypothetical protein